MADANQIAQAIQAAVQAALQQQGQTQQQAMQQIVNQLTPAAPQAPAFARAPALTAQGIIDCASKEGAAIFTNATKPLGNTFSINKPNIRVLVADVKARAGTFGWTP